MYSGRGRGPVGGLRLGRLALEPAVGSLQCRELVLSQRPADHADHPPVVPPAVVLPELDDPPLAGELGRQVRRLDRLAAADLLDQPALPVQLVALHAGSSVSSPSGNRTPPAALRTRSPADRPTDHLTS